eukprot:m.348189 g.348189  ORF g.348189 m.348189 type:complete len:1043 (+) comp19875_c0_seq11:174-3302(+)
MMAGTQVTLPPLADPAFLAEALARTLNPAAEMRKPAEAWLSQSVATPGFALELFKFTFDQSQPPDLRLGAVVLAKNVVLAQWETGLSEEEKTLVRSNLVPTLLACTEQRSLHAVLCEVFRHAVKESDFPARWPDLFRALEGVLTADPINPITLEAGLLVFYQIAKAYQYSRAAQGYAMFLGHLGPTLLRIGQLCVSQAAPSQQHLRLLWLVLKIFHRSIYLSVPEGLVPLLTSLNSLVIASVQVPWAQPPEGDRDTWASEPFWKVKKWACSYLRIAASRYAPGNNQSAPDEAFGREFRSERCTPLAIDAVIQLCLTGRGNGFVAPRTMTSCLEFIDAITGLAAGWKQVKAFLQPLIEEVLFPLLCHSEEDEQLWLEDPVEFIRRQNDIFAFMLPSTAAVSVLQGLGERRGRHAMPMVMTFCQQVLHRNHGVSTLQAATETDGALHIVEALGHAATESPRLRPSLQPLLQTYVFPQFTSSAGFLRARACSCTGSLSEVVASNPRLLVAAMEGILNCMQDSAIPVQVSAVKALEPMLNSEGAGVLRPYLGNVMQSILQLLQEVESDTLTDVLGSLISAFGDDLRPYAAQLAIHLAQAFSACSRYDPNSAEGENRAMTAMGYLCSLRDLVAACHTDRELVANLEQTVLPLVAALLQQGQTSDFYSDAFQLLETFLECGLSADCWTLFPVFCASVSSNMDFFDEAANCLHLYLEKGTPQLIADPQAAALFFNTCERAWNFGLENRDVLKRVARLLELFVLAMPPDQTLATGAYRLIGSRLFVGQCEEAHIDEASTRQGGYCVILAAAFRDPCHLATLREFPGGIAGFLKTLVGEFVDCKGCHPLKMAIMSFAQLLNPAAEPFWPDLLEVWPTFLPPVLNFFGGLPKAEEERQAWLEEEDGSEGEDDSDGDLDEDDSLTQLSDSEDEEDMDQEYLQKQLKMRLNIEDEGDGDPFDHGVDWLSPIDQVDVYHVFCTLFNALATSHPELHARICSTLDPMQTAELKKLLETGRRHTAALEAKHRGETGGYQFTQFEVPRGFAFSGPAAQ